MPYAIKVGDRYLVRSINTKEGVRARRLVEDINEATTWNEVGHVRNAAREAFITRQIPEDAEVEVVELELQQRGVVLRLRRFVGEHGKVYARPFAGEV